MNASAFQHLYDYHFAMNRHLWDLAAQLPDVAFDQEGPYSHGSVRHQLMHLLAVDEGWFTGLRNDPWPEDIAPGAPLPTPARDEIRERWDDVERRMREYLDGLRDEALGEHPWAEGEDKDLRLWEVLFHVVNHGTDHRAQVLRQLADLVGECQGLAEVLEWILLLQVVLGYHLPAAIQFARQSREVCSLQRGHSAFAGHTLSFC